jgi:hypothetical protein
MTDTVMATAALYGANAKANKKARTRRMLTYSVIGFTLLGGLVGVSYYYGNKNLREAQAASGEKAAALRGVGNTGMSGGVLAAVVVSGVLGFLLLMFFVRRTKTSNDLDDRTVENTYGILSNPKQVKQFLGKNGGSSQDLVNATELYAADPENPGSSAAVERVETSNSETTRRNSRQLPDYDSAADFRQEYEESVYSRNSVYYDENGFEIRQDELVGYRGKVYDSPDLYNRNVVFNPNTGEVGYTGFVDKDGVVVENPDNFDGPMFNRFGNQVDKKGNIIDSEPKRNFRRRTSTDSLDFQRQSVLDTLSEYSRSDSGSSADSYLERFKTPEGPIERRGRMRRPGETSDSSGEQGSVGESPVRSRRRRRPRGEDVSYRNPRLSLEQTRKKIKPEKVVATALDKRIQERIEKSFELAKELGYQGNPVIKSANLDPGFGRAFAKEEEIAETRDKNRREATEDVTNDFDKTFIFVYRYLTTNPPPPLGILPKEYANCFERTGRSGESRLDSDMFFLAFFSGTKKEARKRANDFKEKLALLKAREDTDPELVPAIQQTIKKTKYEEAPQKNQLKIRRKAMNGKWKNEAELAYSVLFSEAYPTFEDFVDSEDAKTWLAEQERNAIIQKQLDKLIPNSAKKFMEGLRANERDFDNAVRTKIIEMKKKKKFGQWTKSARANNKYSEIKSTGDIGNISFQKWIKLKEAKDLYEKDLTDDAETEVFRSWKKGNKEFKRILEAYDIFKQKTKSSNDQKFLVWYYLNNGKAVVENTIEEQISLEAEVKQKKQEIWRKLKPFFEHDKLVLKEGKTNYSIESLSKAQKLLKKIDSKNNSESAKNEFKKAFGSKKATRIGFFRDAIAIIRDRYTHSYLRLRGIEAEVRRDDTLNNTQKKVELALIRNAKESIEETLSKLGSNVPSEKQPPYSKRVYDALTKVYKEKARWLTARFNISNSEKNSDEREEKTNKLIEIEDSLKELVDKEIKALTKQGRDNADSRAIENAEISILDNDGRPTPKYY